MNTFAATFIPIRLKGFFSIFKRGMTGVYQHCADKHLHRYLAEFDFRYNHRTKLGFGDIDRTVAAIRGAGGNRLMYRQPREADIPFWSRAVFALAKEAV